MNPLLIGALIGGGAGLLKDTLIDEPEAQRQRTLQAATARYSPWTGLKPQPVKQPNALNAMMQGGMSGATFGQGVQNSNLWGKMAGAFGGQGGMGNYAAGARFLQPLNDDYIKAIQGMQE